MKKNILVSYFTTPFGELILGSFKGELCLCDWKYRKMRESVDNRVKTGLKAEFKQEGSTVVENTKQQLNEYFDRKRTSFDIPLKLVGTQFQKQVWNELQQIPHGETDSYLGLSKKLGNVKAIRAVAAANGANALSILIPCHRIIGSDGSLVGYAGGLSAKEKLLDLEGVLINNQTKLF